MKSPPNSEKHPFFAKPFATWPVVWFALPKQLLNLLVVANHKRRVSEVPERPIRTITLKDILDDPQRFSRPIGSS